MRNYINFIILILFLSVGCKRTSSTMIIPDKCNFINFADSLQIDELMNKPIRILVWADSVGCTGCKLQLDTWENSISELDSIFPDLLGYIFFLQFKEKEDLEFLLGIDDPEDYIDSAEFLDDADNDWATFPLPVVWDPTGIFGKINNIEGYQCFIVDKDNNILYSGEPPFTEENLFKYAKTIKKYLKVPE